MLTPLSKIGFLVLTLLIGACSSSPETTTESKPAPALAPAVAKMDFLLQGRTVKSLSLEEMQKISPAVDYAVTEPHMKVKKTYIAIPLVPVLDSVYGKKWRTMKDFEFTCVDGFKPVYQASYFKKFNPLLAYEEKGSTTFQITKPMENNKIADLAPFYLIWDWAKYPAAEKMGLSAWAYQLVGLNLK